MSVQLMGDRGLWKCFACNERGDLVAFEMKRTGMDFAATVRSLMGWRS